MTTSTLKIHSENILPILKKWLYSDKDIFVRELVSNACDALQKLHTLRERGEAEADPSGYRIEIHTDKEKGQLRFIDNGIGMTSEEVEKYIAQLAFSGAEEFLEKYKGVDEKEQIIGHFGLGFYSAYMVADKVEIQTRSYQKEASPAHWSCDGSAEYSLEPGSRSERGTEITLHLNTDNSEFLEPQRIREILNRYCRFLPFPILLNGDRVNTKEPLWLKPASECTDKEYLDFYRYLYPMDPDPLFWIHLNVDYPFHLKGILYFPKITKDVDFNRASVQLYCSRVFVSDNCKDLIPEYLTMLKGAIDSPDIPLNVSRSYLQMDRTVRQLSGHISKKVCDRLASVYKTEREKFFKAWPDVEAIVKLGCLQDDKFYERAKEFLLWKTLDGQWTTVEEYLERHGESYGHKVYYASHEKEQVQFLDVFRAKGIEILLVSHPLLDSHLMSFLERHHGQLSFQRIDAGLHDVILDTSREKTILDADGKTEAGRIADLARNKLRDEGLEVEAKSLASDTLPCFLLMEEGKRRLRDYFAHSAPEGLESGKNEWDKHTLVLNTNHPLVQWLPKVEAKDPQLAEHLIKELLDLALLSQREMRPNGLNSFIERTYGLLGEFIKKLS